MPITCRIEPDEGLVYTTIEGPTSIQELIAELRRIIADPEFRPRLNGLVDARESAADLRGRDIQRLVDLMSVHGREIGPSRTAIVVSRDVTYGLARMYRALAEGTTIATEVFTDLDEARAWLERGASRRE